MKQPSWPWGLALAALGVGGSLWTVWIIVQPALAALLKHQ